ncbi:MAG: hypothetical protein CVV21_09470 [Candidatus Goldiibacteriota bacterium HGW-Goldbacteria-1]|jgi:hypothetical protein|nr:MAG: hypothetical protein CVV21_09470 [Candidatus Goldiibacteriota bacterium HGW-Goldbacteria-1]
MKNIIFILLLFTAFTRVYANNSFSIESGLILPDSNEISTNILGVFNGISYRHYFQENKNLFIDFSLSYNFIKKHKSWNASLPRPYLEYSPPNFTIKTETQNSFFSIIPSVGYTFVFFDFLKVSPSYGPNYIFFESKTDIDKYYDDADNTMFYSDTIKYDKPYIAIRLFVLGLYTSMDFDWGGIFINYRISYLPDNTVNILTLGYSHSF